MQRTDDVVGVAMTSIGDKAERAIEAGEPFLPLSPDEAALFANTTEAVWLPRDSRVMQAPVLRDDPPAGDNVVTLRARIIRQGALAWLDLRPEIRAAAFRNASLAVDRWAYGRPETCQRALHAAGRAGDGCRFAAAYMFATLATTDLDRLSIAWDGERLRDQLLVAADRLMADGNPCGDVVALALGPWSHGDGQPEDGYRMARAVAHMNAQPRQYNIEAQADGVFARGMVLDALARSWVTNAADHGATVFALGRRRAPYRVQMRVETTDWDSWRRLSRARQPVSLTICGGAAVTIQECALGDMCVTADTWRPAGGVSFTAVYTGDPIDAEPWPVASAPTTLSLAPRMRWP